MTAQNKTTRVRVILNMEHCPDGKYLNKTQQERVVMQVMSMIISPVKLTNYANNLFFEKKVQKFIKEGWCEILIQRWDDGKLYNRKLGSKVDHLVENPELEFPDFPPPPVIASEPVDVEPPTEEKVNA